MNKKSSATSETLKGESHSKSLSLRGNKERLYYENKWRDSFIMSYIKNGNNEMIQLAKEQKIKDEWFFDDSIVTDSAKYNVYRIGHDVSEKNGMNSRFISDAWIYINYDHRKFYVYNGPEDKLCEWKQ